MESLFKSGIIQAKLKIGKPNDIYEQEADRVAEQIVSSSWSVVNNQMEEGEIQRQTEEEERKREEEEEMLQLKKMQGNIPEVTPDLESRIQSVRGGGQPLPKSIRAFFEPRFGYDFSQVRIHNDPEAAKLARALNAEAFTYGRDIYFGEGRYNPGTLTGKKLLAHELTHVVQQKGDKVQSNYNENNFRVQKLWYPDVIQLSPLSEELANIWFLEGRDAFFERLRNLRQSDQDLVDFVEQTLTGEDLLRARSLLSTQRELTSLQRNALFTQLVSRLDSAETDFSRACDQVQEDIRAEAETQAALAKLFVSVAAAFVVPGLGGAITRLINRIPASASVGVYRVALGIQSQAANIASAIGEVGKNIAGQAIDQALASNPRDFCNALVEGFQVTKDRIVTYIRANIDNRSALPDEQLWLYVANWDPREITAPRYAREIRAVWDRYERQVLSIGQFRAYAKYPGLTWSRQTKLVRIRQNEQRRLALIDDIWETGGFQVRHRRRFVTWISPDMEQMAIAMAKVRQKTIPTIEASEVEGIH